MSRKADRNQEIRERHADGERIADLAREFGISSQRIGAIVRPKRKLARSRLYEAVKSGQVVRPATCERCGTPDPEAHHPDYDKPLDVRWLCVECHKAEHRPPSSRITCECEACGSTREVRPSHAFRYCSRGCADQARRADRDSRVKAAAEDLAEYVSANGYVPGTTEFAEHATGNSNRSASWALADAIDPGFRKFGSYAAVMDAVYATAGYDRPKYASRSTREPHTGREPERSETAGRP